MILEVMVVTKMAICLIHHRKQQVNLYREKPYLFNKAKAAVREAVIAAAAMRVQLQIARQQARQKSQLIKIRLKKNGGIYRMKKQ